VTEEPARIEPAAGLVIAAAVRCAQDRLLYLFSRTHEADEQVRLGLVRDDVGRDAAADHADVERRVAEDFPPAPVAAAV